MKQVAIITLPLNNYNYGGILQAFALQAYLKDVFQVEVRHVDRQYNRSVSLQLKTKLYDLLKPNFKKGKQNYYAPIIRFIDNNLQLSEPIYSSQKLDKYLRNNKIDLLITGSDQVWRKQYAFNISEDLFLNFPYNCKKVSYAASFGGKDYKGNEIENKLTHLHSVSVREKTAQEHLQTLGVQVYHHIDPTLLLDKKIYSDLADKSKKDYKGSVTAYLLDRNDILMSNIKTLVKRKDKSFNLVGEKTQITQENCSTITTSVDGVEDWLKAFRDAEYIVTDSFHGCVFSILFNKQFITIGNVDRGLSRFLSLLEMFELQDRLVTSSDGLDMLFNPIDYKNVNKLLENYRKQALDYFSNILLNEKSE